MLGEHTEGDTPAHRKVPAPRAHCPNPSLVQQDVLE